MTLIEELAALMKVAKRVWCETDANRLREAVVSDSGGGPAMCEQHLSAAESDRLDTWLRELRRLQEEVEIFYGEPAPGIYDNPLATKIRFAADQASHALRRARGTAEMVA